MTGIFELGPDFRTMIKICVDHDGSHSGEGQSIREGVCHGDVHGRVRLVIAQDKVEVLIDDPGDIIRLSCVVEGT